MTPVISKRSEQKIASDHRFPRPPVDLVHMLVYNNSRGTPMAVFNIHETKTHFSRLIERVLNGEEIIIAKAGKPVARIVAIEDDMSPRVPGTDKGKVIIHADFDAPLPEFDL